MRFCTKCHHHLTIKTDSGILEFKCNMCKEIYKGEPKDTLCSEIDFKIAESTQKYETILDRSAKDPAGLKVPLKCHKCGLPYLTKVYIGVGSTMMYTCECGANYNKKEYDNGIKA